MAPALIATFPPGEQQPGNPPVPAVASTIDQGPPTPTTSSGQVDWTIYTYGLNGVNNAENGWLSHSLYFSLCLMLVMLTTFRLQRLIFVKIRRVFLLHSHTREALLFWASPAHSIVSFFKRHILWAPIGRLKHNREIRLSSVVNFGTLPTRLQAILLLLYFGSNVVYCTILLDWTLPKPQLIAEFRGRTGVMAVANMVPLFLLAGRNNPLIPLLGISFDTWNLIHRWMGRVVALESTCHVTAWTVNKVNLTGWSGVWEMLRTSPFIVNGSIAGVSFLLILFHSPSPIRHAAYETFLHAHIALAMLGLITLFHHLHIDHLPQIFYVFIIISIWGFDRFCRLFRILYRNCGRRLTRFRVVALPGGDGACRVDIEMVRPWRYTPGSYAFVYLPWVSLWQSHPFSIAWSNDSGNIYGGDIEGKSMNERNSYATSDTEGTASTSYSSNGIEYQGLQIEDLEKRFGISPMNHHNVQHINIREIHSQSSSPVPNAPTSLEVNHGQTDERPWSERNTLSMVMAKRHGMTRALWEMANHSPNKTIYLSGFLEGQYGGHHKLNSYGMVVLIAGGVGITHCIGWVRELLREWKEGRGVARKVVLIWVVPDREQYRWCQEWFNEIFSVPRWDEFFFMQLYVSKPEGNTLVSPSANVPAYAGRPDWDNLFNKFVEDRLGTIGITVCGPGTLSDSVRLAARKHINLASIDFLEESFTW